MAQPSSQDFLPLHWIVIIVDYPVEVKNPDEVVTCCIVKVTNLGGNSQNCI